MQVVINLEEVLYLISLVENTICMTSYEADKQYELLKKLHTLRKDLESKCLSSLKK